MARRHDRHFEQLGSTALNDTEAAVWDRVVGLLRELEDPFAAFDVRVRES
jgi:hypothetical protein